MTINVLPLALFSILLCLSVTGCASTGVQRSSLDRERPLSEKFDPDDARKTVEFMVDSMLQFGSVIELTSQGKPVLDLAPISNRSMDHIDTRALTTSIRTRLIRTGQFRFKDRATADKDLAIDESEIGLVEQSAYRSAPQQATELYLSGEISQMRTQAGRDIDQYYLITMTLKDLRSGEIVWTDEQEIRKERRRPLF